MPLEGLRWSRDSGSALYDTPQNGRSRTGWGGYHLPGAGKMIRILEVGMKRGYSKRMIPLTRAMAWRYDFSSSNGG